MVIILIKKVPILIKLDTYIYRTGIFNFFSRSTEKEKIESNNPRTFRGQNWIKIGDRLIKNKEKNSVCAAKRSWKR